MDQLELDAASLAKAVQGVTALSEALESSRVPTKRTKRSTIHSVSLKLPAPESRRQERLREDRLFIVVLRQDRAQLMDVGPASPRLEDKLVRQLESELSSDAASDFSSLRGDEERVLREGGLDLSERSPDAQDPITRGKAEYRRLLSTALSTATAAKRLRVNESRIRQRLTAEPPTLYGVRVGRAWKLPRFQFTKDGVVPGFEQVLAQVPRDVHPLSFATWLTTPNPDLIAEKSQKELSPHDWLMLGNEPSEVAALASDL